MSGRVRHATGNRLARCARVPRARGFGALVHCASLAVAVLCSSAAPSRAGAQVDPRGPLRTITTAHFHVHFRAEHEAVARRAATYAETAYLGLSRELTAPRGRIDLAIADNVDASNGFAQLFPTNRVVIYAVPPVTIQELRFTDDWLKLVITHELAHIFHLDRARGLWAIGRALFGRNPLLFPNTLTPSWVKEGLAVYYETLLTGSGRNAGTETALVARAAARDSAIPPVSRWSIATTRFPQGQTAYAWGSQLMLRAANSADSANAANDGGNGGNGGTFGMRRFVENTAAYPIPFLLNRRSAAGFGTSFNRLFQGLRDSLRTAAAALDRSGDARWRTISTDGWYAEAPRWKDNDRVLWAASTGREVPGLYEASIGDPRSVRRVARRNGLDANIPLGGDSTLFGQVDFVDPYSVRSDLYEGQGTEQRAITRGARLTQPDVRNDGAIVAVQLQAEASRIVRVGRDGRITPLTGRAGLPRVLWAEPRWSPDGRFIAAVELLPNGDQRVMVLDSTGAVVRAVAGGRAVFASPAWAPGGDRLLWTSDRSGRMQLETTAFDPSGAVTPDTAGWRDERNEVRVASNVTTGVYQPSISPDGRQVLALLYRVDGFHVAVAPLDTAGAMARGGWYARAEESAAAAARTPLADGRETTAPVRGYGWARQLLPRYWFPEFGIGRDDGTTYGFSTSANDILARHAWYAQGVYNPRLRETDASAQYRFGGLGMPLLDVFLSQEWDATFRVADSTNRELGTLGRRRRFANVSASISRPRVRLSMNGSIGLQYEWRDFTSTFDSLRGPPGSPLRTGTRYPSLLVSGGLSTVRRAGRSIAYEEGFTLSGGTTYRWRQDAPSLGSWRSVGTARGYVPLDLPGYSRHVLSARLTGGLADRRTATEFSVGGVSGLSADLAPGVTVGDPARSFPVRGVEPDAQRGIRAIGGTVEYRVPLLMLRDVPSPFTVYADRISLSLFSDAARATCPASLAAANGAVCERPGVRDGIIASAGAELSLDLAIQYDVPMRFRLGGGVPYAGPPEISRTGRFYVTLGSYF
jgi:hypothetical protein